MLWKCCNPHLLVPCRHLQIGQGRAIPEDALRQDRQGVVSKEPLGVEERRQGVQRRHVSVEAGLASVRKQDAQAAM